MKALLLIILSVNAVVVTYILIRNKKIIFKKLRKNYRASYLTIYYSFRNANMDYLLYFTFDKL